MSIFRRRLTARASKLVLGIDFSKQPDNEVWYITRDNKKYTKPNNSVFYTGGWGKQVGLEVVNHTYENGLGKVTYNVPVNRIGESAFRNVPSLLISTPKTCKQVGAWSLSNSYIKVDYLIILCKDRRSIFSSQLVHIHEPKNMIVMPGNIDYYKYIPSNIIERNML